jgi:O-Antigen ligase
MTEKGPFGSLVRSDKLMPERYSRSAAAQVPTDNGYLTLLAFLLAGYAIFSKAFAYIGFGSLYIGEIVFALGIVALWRSGCAFVTLATLPSLLLGLLCGWAIIRTLPYLSEFGLDALRDSVVVGYGGFAFIVTGLLLEKPERLALAIRFLRVLGSVIVIVGPILLVLRATWIGEIALQKPASLAVHLSGVALMMLLGFRRARISWLLLLIIGMAVASMMSRAAILIIIIPITFAVIVTGKWREFTFACVIGAVLIGSAWVLAPAIPTNSSRDISVTQLTYNFTSIVEDTGSATDPGALEGTKSWRKAWWNAILSYTLDGPYFWTGKGFGINLALDDGFIAGNKNSDVPLTRGPHNGHLTILARTGVPGLALWLLTLGSWGVMLMVNMVRARVSGDNAWAHLFVLIFCYALGFIIEGTFDVSLEGPMSAIWLWCLFGAGIGATMIYRAHAASVGIAGAHHATNWATRHCS